MVLASHVVFSAYSFWLPNDPRGSWSDFVGAWELRRFGAATKTLQRRSHAHDSHDRERRLAAKSALKRPAVVFTGRQARAVARGFAAAAQKHRLVVHACSILPEHVHMVVARHRHRVEVIVNLLKGAATREVANEGLHPFADRPTRSGRFPKMWTRGEWKVFLNSPADIVRAIRYVDKNPLREGKRQQDWKFVVPYEQIGPRTALPGAKPLGRG